MYDTAATPERGQPVKVVTVCDTQRVANALSSAAPRRTATSGQVGTSARPSDHCPVRHCHSCHRTTAGNAVPPAVRGSRSEQWHGASSYATAADSCNGDCAPQRRHVIGHAEATSKVPAASALCTGSSSCPYEDAASTAPAQCDKKESHTRYCRTAGQPTVNIDGKRRFGYKGAEVTRGRESMWRAHVCELARAGVAMRMFDSRTCVALSHWLHSGLAPAALGDDDRRYCQAHFGNGYGPPALRHYMDVIMHGDQWTAQVARRSAAAWRCGDGPATVGADKAAPRPKATADKATQCAVRRRPLFLVSRSTQTDL